MPAATIRPDTRHRLISALLLAALAVWGLAGDPANAKSKAKPHHDHNPHSARSRISGVVEGDAVRQSGYHVSLYVTYEKQRGHGGARVLGTARTNRAGRFTIDYRFPSGLHRHQKPVFYLLAEQGKSMLAAAIDENLHRDHVVLNERTTVAIGVAFAQFIDGRKIEGNKFGVSNAVKMAGNMADPSTGDISQVLDNSPNADKTSTRKTFNSMANMVASCVADESDCDRLFEYTTPRGGATPTTVLQAVANMTRYPSRRVLELFELSTENPIYAPALVFPSEKPTSWLLFIKFTGGQYFAYRPDNLMAGPGNLAFDERGFAWINDNYVPTFDLQVSCAGLRLMKFYPWGENHPRSPFFGGGLSGAGFGITLDPRGRIWVGNFGFEAPLGACEDVAAPHNSVSLFRPDGRPISGSDGFTEGHIWWPQGTVSDKKGNIWLANCGNDTVTIIPRGKPRRARNVALPGGQGADGNFQPNGELLGDTPRLKPFDISIDPQGRAWVTANLAPGDAINSEGLPVQGRVFRISPDGTVEPLSTLDARGKTVLSWPMGISGDSQGNMWVSNSNSVNVPCVDPLAPQDGEFVPSVALYPADGGDPKSYSGGGLTIPWGNAVDGNDTLWVFNFGQQPTSAVDEDSVWPDTPLSHFCGVDTSKCPAGKKKGEAISPPKGYVSDALDRITGGQIDPSGNVWLLNNWKKTGPFERVYNTNPGGNSFVIVPGAAGPVKTPLIGPPRSF